MTTFDDRQKGFEKKFAHDAELKFKAESRRSKMLAEWAAAKMGLSGAAVEDYVKAVRKADLAEKGDDDVFRKVAADLADKGIKVTDAELRAQDDRVPRCCSAANSGGQELSEPAGVKRKSRRRRCPSCLRNQPNRISPSGHGPWPEADVQVTGVACLDQRCAPGGGELPGARQASSRDRRRTPPAPRETAVGTTAPARSRRVLRATARCRRDRAAPPGRRPPPFREAACARHGRQPTPRSCAQQSRPAGLLPPPPR